MVRNVADLGHPTACPVSASMSSIDRSISCISRITFSTENVPMRLPIKFALSFVITTPLPSCTSQKLRDRVDQAAIRFRRRNDFEKPHVARRIEEVCPEPTAAEVVGKSFRQFCRRASRWCWL